MRILSLNSRAWSALLGSTVLISAPVIAQEEANVCYAPDGVTEIACIQSNSDVAIGIPTAPNTERAEGTAGAGFEETGFSLSIEDQTVAGAEKPEVPQREQDRALVEADVQVKFDGLEIIPRLNVSTSDLRASYTAGQTVTFRTSTNYPAWIARAEVIVIDRATRVRKSVAALPVQPNGQVSWTMPSDGSGEYGYVLRVYDDKGRYNETAQLDLNRTGNVFERHETTDDPLIAAGEGEDRTAVTGIPLYGGSVTASGDNVQPGTVVEVMGERAIVDPRGRFVMQRILPPGEHVVDVQVKQNGRVVDHVGRSIEIPEDEWFYVAIADVTIYKKLEDELEGTIAESDEIDVDGRAAFYLKGRINGRTLTKLVERVF